MILYDIINKKFINIDDLTIDIKKDIINNKIRPLNEKEFKNKKSQIKVNNYESYFDSFKIKNSTDEVYLPLYDINNNNIYFIHKKDIFYVIKEYNFRPLNDKLVKFIEDNINEKAFYLDNTIINQNISNIIKYFNYEILEETLLRFIFYYTSGIGGDMSFLLNPAFISFLDINPYLKKSSILNTAQNLGIIKASDLSEYKSDSKIKEIYKEIKYIFFSKSELLSHMKHISDNEMIRILKFYTMYGAFFLNTYIRDSEKIYYDGNIVNQINRLTNLIKTSPKLESKKIIFRFVKTIPPNLSKKKVGDIYVEDSFLSCTRKPHVNAINDQFGFILIKINIPKGVTGSCLSIESDSVFPNEKEVILAPGSKFKILSIDDNVDFYAFNKKTEQNIKSRYEVEFIGFDKYEIPKREVLTIPDINFLNQEVIGEDLEEKINYFFDNYGRLRRFNLVLPDGSKKLLYCNFYNGNDIYSKFFYYKIPDGFFIYSYNENNEIDLFIEIGDEIVVNFPSQYISIISHPETKKITSLLSFGFKVNKINIYPDYIKISELSKNDIFTSRIYINCILYRIINDDKIKDFSLDKLQKVRFFLNNMVPVDNVNYNLQKYLPDINWTELLRNILELNPQDVKHYLISIPNNVRNLYYDFYPYPYLLNNSLINIIPTGKSTKYESKRIKKSPEFFTIEHHNFRTLVN